MAELYKVEGILNQGFMGHIMYIVNLEHPYKKLSVSLEYDPRLHKCIQNPEALREACKDAVREYVPLEKLSVAMVERLSNAPKTEINLSIFLCGDYLGGIFREEPAKKITFSPDYILDGANPYAPMPGPFKIILHVVSILNDNTNYKLTVEGEL